MLKFLSAALIVTAVIAPVPFAAQGFGSLQRDTGREMLRDMAEAVRKNYYDPKFHGVDLDGVFKAAEDRIRSATNFGEVFLAIGQAIDKLDDSHTFFVPPRRATQREYGYTQQMIAERWFVTAVRPDSNAGSKLLPGDEILTWEGFTPTSRQAWSKMTYAFTGLQALPVLHYVIRSSDGSQRNVEIEARLKQGKRVLDLTGNGDGDIWQVLRERENDERANRHRTVALRQSLLIWKMPEFDLTDDEVDRQMKEVRKFPALVLDLRRNPGGFVKTLEHLTGSVMDHDVIIGKRVGRKSGLKPVLGKSRGKEAFSGKLIVLIDSSSASAAELFARVIQLEHRGTVLGDRSSGSVMESRYYPFKQGLDTRIFYGGSVTDADIMMKDGKSLEHDGVVPDEVILPTPADLSSQRDPVLARAASLAGVDLDPVDAGKLFPIEWR